MYQTEIISLDELVGKDHPYRKFNKLWSFKNVMLELESVKGDSNYTGFGLDRLFKCLLLQYMEDLSDRELQRYLHENTAAKWFCGFTLTEKTPTYSLFSKLRARIGTTVLSKIFKNLRDQLKEQGVITEIFNFVDASSLVSKANLWKERDKSIKKKYDKLNNEVLQKVAYDKQAKIGCKGNDKYWYGYKEHVSVDMQSGLINKIAITPANVNDADGLKHVCPSQGSIYADKGYCWQSAKRTACSNGCHLSAIKKNNMKSKNVDLDRWRSKIRSPHERVFSKRSKRVRFKGVEKNQFSAFMRGICYNLKRLIVLDMPEVCLA